MLKNTLFLGMLLLVLACNKTTADQQEDITEVEGGIAEIIRNPVSAGEETVDTSNVAKLMFTTSTYEFERVDAGAIINHDFSFTNEGSVPLIISDVRSTCGCTVAEWPRKPIAPGESGVIPVRFDTKNKNGIQNKPITITANTFPAKSVIYLNGQVDGESS